MSNGFLKITLRRSPIGYEKSQRLTAEALGLRKLQATVTQPDNPQIRGMVRKITHLLQVEAVAADAVAEAGVAVAAPAVEKEPKKTTRKKAAEEETPAVVDAEEEAKKPVRRRTTKKAEESPVAEEQEETK